MAALFAKGACMANSLIFQGASKTYVKTSRRGAGRLNISLISNPAVQRYPRPIVLVGGAIQPAQVMLASTRIADRLQRVQRHDVHDHVLITQAVNAWRTGK